MWLPAMVKIPIVKKPMSALFAGPGRPSLSELGWEGLPFREQVVQQSAAPAQTKSRITAKIDSEAKTKVRSYNKALFPLLCPTGALCPLGSARHRLKRERFWWRMTEQMRLACPLCPDYETWSVYQKRSHYHQLHGHISSFVGIPKKVMQSSMSDMRSFFSGGSVEHRDGCQMRCSSPAAGACNVHVCWVKKCYDQSKRKICLAVNESVLPVVQIFERHVKCKVTVRRSMDRRQRAVWNVKREIVLINLMTC